MKPALRLKTFSFDWQEMRMGEFPTLESMKT